MYIFALLAHRDPSTLDPLDLDQWEFYLAPSFWVEAQTCVSLESLQSISGPAKFNELREAFDEAEYGLRAARRAAPGGRQLNAINVIHPYKHAGLWVFDDAAVGLVREPFVSGADDVIEAMVSAIPDADSGFTLIFSATPFPGHQAVFEWRREETGGNWYFSPDLGREGWLCPALFKYFEQTPPRIFAKFEPRKV